MEDFDTEERDEPDLEQGARELENLKSLQVFLNGYEAHALIVAAQLLQISPHAKNLGPVGKAALIAGRKMQRLFLTSPHTYALLQRGWDLMEHDNQLEEN